jgi:hypothetical protein
MTGVGGVVACNSAERVKPTKLDGSASWAVFHRKFEAAADHNKWKSCEKSEHLLAVLHEQGSEVLHNVQAGATCVDIAVAVNSRCGDQSAAAYTAQLKSRTLIGESRQGSAAAVDQLAHRTRFAQPVNFIQSETARIFVDEVRHRYVTQHLLMGGHRSHNVALNLDVAKQQPDHQRSCQK